MDTILTGLLNFGIGSAMAAAVIYLVYYTLTRTIPELTERHRLELADQRDRYHQLLRAEHDMFRATLAAIEARSQETAEHICRALEAVQRESAEQSRQLAALTAVIQRCARTEDEA